MKEHGIQDWEIELESEEEDSQDEIPRGPQDLVESEEEDSRDEIPRGPQYLVESEEEDSQDEISIDGHKIWKDDWILSNYLEALYTRNCPSKTIR